MVVYHKLIVLSTLLPVMYIASLNLALLIIVKADVVALWLVSWTPDLVVQVHALARFTALCSWARHFTLAVPLFTQVYK